MSAFGMPDDGSNLPNREELLQLAITAAKNGNKESAHHMLEKVINEDKKNERAMLWMARIADTKEERIRWLKRVIEINPGNETAANALRSMAHKTASSDNRTLLIFGVVAGVLLVIAVAIVILVLAT